MQARRDLGPTVRPSPDHEWSNVVKKIVLLPGDGVGPEVTREAAACLEMISDRYGLGFVLEEHDFGGVAIDRHGTPLPEATLAACRNADAVLLGAVGGPKWDQAPERPEIGLLGLRAALGLFANLRPTRVLPGLEHLSPLRKQFVTAADVLVVRELTGGSYFGEKRLEADVASDLCKYTRVEIERIAHRLQGRAAAREEGDLRRQGERPVQLKLWRRVVEEIALDYPDVTLDHMHVDAAAHGADHGAAAA